jgi:molecular chaperone DnaK
MTIDFGIDLGTTNSSIARLLDGTRIEVFKNNLGHEITPSAVWIDGDGSLYVGIPAKARLETDRENAFCEFKLQMGTGHEYRFSGSGRVMRPENLSAEILKSLKADVRKRTGEDIQAAVITVPAAFEAPQVKATNEAARLAGFSISPLLQEPSAAAIAYGFQSASDKGFWLVYDFGGGTFDAAIVQVRDGVIEVINNGGDNHLGGKLIDWEIVEQLVVPALLKQHDLTDFRRGNPKWNAAFGKLKLKVEEAKIQVSERESAKIEWEYLCLDEQGQPVSFEYVLRKGEVERLAEPFILQSINICRKVLAEKNLRSGALEKVILVGGPTLMPYLRERLADSKEGLGVPLDFSKDPLTVVAQGAAIFAGGQRTQEAIKTTPGRYAVMLDYKPMDNEPAPLVGGRVIAPDNRNLSGFTLEFINAKDGWRSGKIGLKPDGTFVERLRAGENPPQNRFVIELCDASGTICSTEPNEFPYTLTTGIPTAQLLAQSLGVALASNDVLWFHKKNTRLPARRLVRDLRTSVEVRRGQHQDLLKVPIVEGENARADRNPLIGSLTIPADRIQRDVPLGSEIEVTIKVDESRLITVSALVPVLGEEFDLELSLEKPLPDKNDLEKAVEDAKRRLSSAREIATETADLDARGILERIDGEGMVHNVETALLASQGDRDATDKCEKSLLGLNLAIDQLEAALAWPSLLVRAEETIRRATELITQLGNQSEKQELGRFEQKIRGAMAARDSDQLRRALSLLEELDLQIRRRQPEFWINGLNWLVGKKAEMKNSVEAEQWFAQARRAVNDGDMNRLQIAVRQLALLLPPGQQQKLEQGHGSTVRLG